MTARAAAAAATGERILDAAAAEFWDRPSSEIPLSDVAARAEVSVQTVLRHFGDKQALFAAAAAREAERIERQRADAVGKPLQRVVRVLVDHYEEMGEGVLRLLAEEQRLPALRAVAERGRAAHRRWCERVFAAALAERRGAARERLRAELVAVCDVYTWKILRFDCGLGREAVGRALVEILQPMLAPGRDDVKGER